MAIFINALARGGYSTFGGASYDQRAGAVVIQAANAEIVNVKAQFPVAIASVNYDREGIETSEPVISGASIAFELSNFTSGARIRYDVMLADGDMRQLPIEIAGASARRIVSSGGDYGSYP